MYGYHVSVLNVYVANAVYLGQPVFTRKGTQDNNWMQGQIEVNSKTYKVGQRLLTSCISKSIVCCYMYNYVAIGMS
jgi:hypothetical protein